MSEQPMVGQDLHDLSKAIGVVRAVREAREIQDKILASITRDALADEDFYFYFEDGGYTHIDGHLKLTPEQIVAVKEVRGA